MKFRKLSQEISEKEIRLAFTIVSPDATFKHYQRKDDYIRVWYTHPHENKEHKLDLLPDNVYFVDGEKESKETPLTNCDTLFHYYQFMIARGYSEVWKDNPYTL